MGVSKRAKARFKIMSQSEKAAVKKAVKRGVRASIVAIASEAGRRSPDESNCIAKSSGKVMKSQP